jgi:signal transduction histidine kinase/DNA-binding NarL/FixJ family response regulator
MLETTNSRILVIDDEEVVRDSIRLILASRPVDNKELDAFAADLFDDLPAAPRPHSTLVEFTVDEAATGRAGLELVRAALAARRPYAAIFVDMRMPGWDGLETVQHIREIDRQAEIVFITAYSDSTIEEIVERAGPNVGYHLKPFAPDEIKQIATKAIYDWNKLRRLEKLIEMIGTLKVNATELDALLDHVFHQVVGWVGTDSALLGRKQEEGHFEPLFATGSLREKSVATQYLHRLSEAGEPDAGLERNFICFHLEQYDIVALLERSDHVNSEKLYLLDLFIRHAGQAIENLRLHETVMRSEKLAAVGLAIGKVAHDLRSPIAAIQAAINMIRESPGEDALIEKLLGLMYTSSEEALALAADLLSFTRNAAASPTLIVTAHFFKGLQERMQASLALSSISLRLEDDDVKSFAADGNLLRRALLNLLQNAAEALRNSAKPDPAIRLRLSRQGDFIKFEVADNGPGIPLSVRPTLFEPFVTSGKPSGTGLGLAIVRQAAEAHGGSVSYETSEAGTRFVIQLFQPQPVALPAVSEITANQS